IAPHFQLHHGGAPPVAGGAEEQGRVAKRKRGVSGDRKTLAIVGLGLLGASIAEAARKRYPGWKIIGVSSPKTVKDALALKVIDEGFDCADIRAALGACDWGFLCVPIDRILECLAEWAAEPLVLKPGAILSDVGSTKAEICAAARKAF